jgi:hypothetical protein
MNKGFEGLKQCITFVLVLFLLAFIILASGISNAMKNQENYLGRDSTFRSTGIVEKEEYAYGEEVDIWLRYCFINGPVIPDNAVFTITGLEDDYEGKLNIEFVNGNTFRNFKKNGSGKPYYIYINIRFSVIDPEINTRICTKIYSKGLENKDLKLLNNAFAYSDGVGEGGCNLFNKFDKEKGIVDYKDDKSILVAERGSEVYNEFFSKKNGSY